MPIKVSCNCGQKFSVKEAMGGKRVKCPKCNEPLTIPKPRAAPPQVAPVDTMADLLDEVGVKSARTGPVCPQCNADMQPQAIICIDCGFNVNLGRKMRADDGMEDSTAGMTPGEALLAKAERELDEQPYDDNVDFGDGPEKWIISGAAFVGLLILTGIGIGTIVLLDEMEQSVVVKLSVVVCIMLVVAGYIWTSVTAFLESMPQGMLLTGSAIFGCAITLFAWLSENEDLIKWASALSQFGFGYFHYYATTRACWVPYGMYMGGTLLGNILVNVAAGGSDL